MLDALSAALKLPFSLLMSMLPATVLQQVTKRICQVALHALTSQPALPMPRSGCVGIYSTAVATGAWRQPNPWLACWTWVSPDT